METPIEPITAAPRSKNTASLEQAQNEATPEAEVDVVALPLVADQLKQNGLTLEGSRISLSAGFHGPIFELRTSEGPSVVEVAFTRGGNIESSLKSGKSHLLVDRIKYPGWGNARWRLGIVDRTTGDINKVAIDSAYNSEQAFQALQGISGIPKFYGLARERSTASLLVEKIDGFDLFDTVAQVKNIREFYTIFEKLIETYCQAAEKGYVYNNPAGSTIMVDRTTIQPYLLDWYDHQYGSLQTDKHLQSKFLQGIEAINHMRGSYLEEFFIKHDPRNKQSATYPLGES